MRLVRYGTGPGPSRSFDADVYWRDPDGRVTVMSPGDGLYMMSCVHPSGSHAVFWGGSKGRPRLWTGDGSRTFEPLTDARSSARYPAYNADGTVLAYCRSSSPAEYVELLRHGRTVMPGRTTGMAIVVRASDGAWEREVTDGSYQDQRPALSPDGSELVFVSDRSGGVELWAVGTAGGDPWPLLPGVPAYRPWWSVDGRHIFFFTLGPSRHRLHVVPATGGVPKPLTNDDRGDTHGPFADPDGRTLLAHSTRSAVEGAWGRRGARRAWGIHEFPLDGTAPRWLCHGAHATRAANGVLTFDVRRPR